MTPAEPANGSLLWCAGCRLAFFAIGTRAEVRARAGACGWLADGSRYWCDRCAPAELVRPRPGVANPAPMAGGAWSRWDD